METLCLSPSLTCQQTPITAVQPPCGHHHPVGIQGCGDLLPPPSCGHSWFHINRVTRPKRWNYSEQQRGGSGRFLVTCRLCERSEEVESCSTLLGFEVLSIIPLLPSQLMRASSTMRYGVSCTCWQFTAIKYSSS